MAKPGNYWLQAKYSNDSSAPERWAGMNQIGVVKVFADKTSAQIWSSSNLKTTGSEWFNYAKDHPLARNIGKG
jgi:hypothetical protein